MDLSIIIVNWNSVKHLRECLASIYDKTEGISFEVVVIDNASYDGCAEMLAREFPAVRFIQSQENLGFARANNLGFEHSSGRNVLFLNPDTEIVGPALEHLVRAMDSDSRVAVAGPKLLNTDGSIQTSCIQRFPTVLNQMLDSDYLRQKFPSARLWGTRPLREDAAGLTEVEVISGASLMVKREVFEAVGRFSTRYFMYSEDVDLCYEVRKCGWKVCYAGAATVIHHGGRSSSSKPESHYSSIMTRQAVATFLRAKRGRTYSALYRATTAIAALGRCALAGLAAVFAYGQPRRARCVQSLQKWSNIFRWAVGLEGWARMAAPNGNGQAPVSAC